MRSKEKHKKHRNSEAFHCSTSASPRSTREVFCHNCEVLGEPRISLGSSLRMVHDGWSGCGFPSLLTPYKASGLNQLLVFFMQMGQRHGSIHQRDRRVLTCSAFRSGSPCQ